MEEPQLTTLHITNGDATVDLLRHAGFSGTFLPWRDILHLGPVPSDLPLEQLSTQRAAFIAGMGWADQSSVEAAFVSRDQQLAQAGSFDSIMLWFEHDLYDQLQILQLLSWFDERQDLLPRTQLINPDKHLGYHTPEEAKALVDIAVPVTQQMTTLAVRGWLAYGRQTPEDWASLLTQDTSVLPHLHNAILQSMGELPSSARGLTDTESRILSLIDSGHTNRRALFRQYCNTTPAQFHGDMSFFWLLDQLLLDQPLLLEEKDDELSLTALGTEVLNNATRWQRHYSNKLWLGGYRIDNNPIYCWDNANRDLIKREV